MLEEREGFIAKNGSVVHGYKIYENLVFHGGNQKENSDCRSLSYPCCSSECRDGLSEQRRTFGIFRRKQKFHGTNAVKKRNEHFQLYPL